MYANKYMIIIDVLNSVINYLLLLFINYMPIESTQFSFLNIWRVPLLAVQK